MSHQSLRLGFIITDSLGFIITDKDMAELNCLARVLNGAK